MAEPEPHPPRPALRLRIGVVGHRPKPDRPFDEGRIRASLAEMFARLETCVAEQEHSTYDKARPPQVTLISALAEGADQIATEVFLAERPGFTGKRRLEAILPFGEDDYALTFLDPDAKPEREAQAKAAAGAMRRWVSRADAVLSLEDWAIPDAVPLPALARHRRDTRFATLGQLIVRQSDLVVAIWDRMPAQGPGGTAESVAAAMGQGVPVIWVNAADGTAWLIADTQPYGDLFELIDHCKCEPSAELLAKALKPLIAAPDGSKAEGERLEHYLSSEAVPGRAKIRSFYYRMLVNPARKLVRRQTIAAAIAKGKHPPERLARWKGRVQVDYVRTELENPAWPGYPQGTIDYAAHLARFARAWGDADAIGTRLGHVYRSGYLAIFLLAPLAVFMGLLGLLLFLFKGYLVAAEMLLLLSAIGIFTFSARWQHHKRWLDSRALGEQFRAHWALALLGGAGRRSPAGGEHDWNNWLFNAYAADLSIPTLRMDLPTLGVIARTVNQGIVASQRQYHHDNHAHLSAIHRRLEGWSKGALLGAVVAAALLLVIWPWCCQGNLCIPENMTLPDRLARFTWLPHELRGWSVMTLTILCGTLPALGASMAGIRYHGDFERFAERSEQTVAALDRIGGALDSFAEHLVSHTAEADQPLRFETLLAIFTELERILLSDLEDWRFVYRARPSPEPG